MSRATVAVLELSLYRGEDYIGRGAHKQTDRPTAEAVDISDWSIRVTVKTSADDAEDPIIEADADITNGPAGLYSFTFEADDTAELEERDYVIDIWRVDLGAKTALAKGKLTVRQPVRTPA